MYICIVIEPATARYIAAPCGSAAPTDGSSIIANPAVAFLLYRRSRNGSNRQPRLTPAPLCGTAAAHAPRLRCRALEAPPVWNAAAPWVHATTTDASKTVDASTALWQQRPGDRLGGSCATWHVLPRCCPNRDSLSAVRIETATILVF